MAKSAIYLANTNTQNLTAGSTINFGTGVHKFGCLSSSGGNVQTTTGGYYNIKANLTIQATGTTYGTAVVTLYYNGTPITGATASADLSATSSTVSVCIPALIRQSCNCNDGTITAVLSGIDASVTNAGIVVTKE